MRIHIEVVTGGRRGRRRIATIERGADVGADNGIGLALGEVKGLLERLQGIVAAEHAQEVVSANFVVWRVRARIASQRRGRHRLSHRVRQAPAFVPAAVLAVPVRCTCV